MMMVEADLRVRSKLPHGMMHEAVDDALRTVAMKRSSVVIKGMSFCILSV